MTEIAKLTTWDVEVTDTFCGEANYAWVRRYTTTLPADASDRAVVRAVKRAGGYSGARGRSGWMGGDETYEFRPYGEHVVLFATPRPFTPTTPAEETSR